MKLERSSRKLHRVANKHFSDWEDLDPTDMNSWQHIAFQTKGLLTIGNLLTVIGFLLVLSGAVKISQEQYLLGTILIGVGRLLDYLDGIAADMTRTKSRLGASFDEVADALGLGLALIIFLVNDTMPLVLLILIALPKSLNALSWCVSKIRRIRMDTTAQSKIATFIIWSGILLYLLYHSTDTLIDPLFQYSGWSFTILGSLLSAPSSLTYLRTSIKRLDGR